MRSGASQGNPGEVFGYLEAARALGVGHLGGHGAGPSDPQPGGCGSVPLPGDGSFDGTDDLELDGCGDVGGSGVEEGAEQDADGGDFWFRAPLGGVGVGGHGPQPVAAIAAERAV